MKKILFIATLLLLFNTGFAQGYKIEIKIKGAENAQVILGHHKGENLLPDDTVKTDKSGYGVFSDKKTLTPGMYILFLPNRNYFDFIVGDDQSFLIENDTTDLVANLKISNSTEGQLFVDYQKFMIDITKKMNQLNDKYKAEPDTNKKHDIEKQMNAVNSQFTDYQASVITKNSTLFFTKFLKATQEVVIPDTIKDRYRQYVYYKTHYFDNFDLSDIRLLYTPIYDAKIDKYLDNMVAQIPDSLNKEIDMMLAKADKNADLYQYLLIKLYNKYAKSQMMISENIFVHIADIYIKRATWSPDSFRNELNTKITRKKNCLVGNTAQNMHLMIIPNDSAKLEMLRAPLDDMKQKGLAIENDKKRTFDQKLPELSSLIAEFLANVDKDADLKDVKAKYTILWFMSPTCSHCIEETPKFYEDYVNKLQDKGVVVWSILLEANTDNWQSFSSTYSQWFDFIEKHHLFAKGWYNLTNPFDNFRFKYDISSSPVLFLLDKDKKIIAKKIGYDQAVEIILDMENPHQ